MVTGRKVLLCCFGPQFPVPPQQLVSEEPEVSRDVLFLTLDWYPSWLEDRVVPMGFSDLIIAGCSCPVWGQSQTRL